MRRVFMAAAVPFWQRCVTDGDVRSHTDRRMLMRETGACLPVTDAGAEQKECSAARYLQDSRIVHWQTGSNPHLKVESEYGLFLFIRQDDEHVHGPGRIAAVMTTDSAAKISPPLYDLLVVLYCIFDEMPDVQAIELDLREYPDLARSLRQRGLGFPIRSDEDHAAILECRRQLLWQISELWMTMPAASPCPLHYIVTNGKRHPFRAEIPRGIIYRRFIASLGKVVSFRTIDLDADLETFHRWMNTPRVASFWELQGSIEEHADYIRNVLADAHLHPLIGCFDDQPFGYFEVYWAKEDRVAPFYPVDDYDRGLHMLVGEECFRGPHFVAAWLQSLVHCLFLDDPRTRNVVAEPRADNARMINYLQAAGFHKLKEFDFPHKRAAMMVLPREVYFDQFCP